MPLPEPISGETQEQFIERCMGDETMQAEFEDEDQRYAICTAQWQKAHEASARAVEAVLGDVEVRTFHRGTLRVMPSDEGPGTIIGAPGIPYNRPSEDLGGFIERINPHALDETLGDYDVVCCRDHEDHLVLGRVSAGTLVLENTPQGLNYACVLPEVSYARDLAESIRRGDVCGSSFRFTVLEDRWDASLREVLKMELYEVGPVTMPAYPSTALSLRSLLRAVGVDSQQLGVAVRRARSGQLQGQDIDVIQSAIRALAECLPARSQGAEGVAGGARQGLELLRRRLQTLEI